MSNRIEDDGTQTMRTETKESKDEIIVKPNSTRRWQKRRMGSGKNSKKENIR